MYQACKSYEPCCHLRPVRLHNIFPIFLIHDMIFGGKNSIEHKINVLIFFTTLKNFSLLEPFREIISQIYIYIDLQVKYLLFVSDFNETWIFSTYFLKFIEFQISWKSVQWEPDCSMRTDRHDEANSRFTQFCEREQIWKRCKIALHFNFLNNQNKKEIFIIVH